MRLSKQREKSESALTGIQQAREYALSLGALCILDQRHEIEEFDFVTNKQSTMPTYPSPDELLARYNISRLPRKLIESLKVPFFFSKKIPRYYQEVAVKNIIESYILGRRGIALLSAIPVHLLLLKVTFIPFLLP